MNTQMTADETRHSNDESSRWGRVLLLVGGDAAILLLFAATGRSNHGEAVSAGSILATAAPFLIAWFALAFLLDAFGLRGEGTTRPGALLLRSLPIWVAAWAVALILRHQVFGGGISLPFAIVALLFNGVLLLLWRLMAVRFLLRR